MKISKIENNTPSFGIKVSPDIIKAADDFYVKNNHSQEQFNKIYRKAKYMEENYGFNEYTIFIKSFSKDGKRYKGLFAQREDNNQSVLLAAKNNLRKIFERFTRISEYELNNKLL